MKHKRRNEEEVVVADEPVVVERITAECVKTVGNNIYFYAEICPETIMKFNTTLKILERDISKAASEYSFHPEINVYIQTDGGDVYCGLSAMDHIKSCSVHVNTIIDGCVCSSGTLMMLGGHSKYIMRHSSVLIHQIRTGFWGKWEELKDEKENCEKLMNILSEIYLKETNISKKKLKNLLKRELFLNADECIKYGIAEHFY